MREQASLSRSSQRIGFVAVVGLVALAAGALTGHTGRAAWAQPAAGDGAGTGVSNAAAVDDLALSAPVDLDALGLGDGVDTIFTSKSGKFVYDSNWRNKLGAECNIIGELRDCSDQLIIKVGTDTPEWTGWQQHNGKWIRSYGEIRLLPSQCGVHFYIIDPASNLFGVDDPCPALKPTATPVPGGGGGGTIPRTCSGSSVTSHFTIRSGGDDVVWSRQRGLEISGQILSFGGSQVYDPIVGLRITGVPIPRNALIFSAIFKVAPAANSNIDSDQRIYGADVGNLGGWSSPNPGTAPRTTASSVWQIRGQWNGSQSCGFVSSSSFSPAIQEIVDRSDWSLGNALGIMSEWEGPFVEASQRPAWSLEGGCAPQMTITWCPAIFLTGPTATPKGGAIVTATPTKGSITEPSKTPTPKGTLTATATIPSTDVTPTATATAAESTATPTPASLATDTPTPASGATATDTPTPFEITKTPTSTTTATALAPATDTPTPEPASPTPTLVAGATATPTGNWCNSPYDLNDDGVVDVLDIDIILHAFGSTPGDPNWDPRADVNHDNIVDILDYLIVREYFGPACPVPKGGVGGPNL